MKTLALDVGKRRIGVAVSDDTGTLARAVGVIRHTSLGATLESIVNLVRELGAEAVLIGRPLHLSGYAGAQAGYVERLGEHLRRVLGIPIVYWDERLSTVSAERELRDMGYAASQRAAMRDAVAAAIILQSYLDAQRRQDRDTPSVLTG